MTLIQFIDRVIEKVRKMPMPEVKGPMGMRDNPDRATVLSCLNICQQIANHKGTKFWNPPNIHFKNPWIDALPIILKHDPKFFEEFKDDDQARQELKEIIGKA